MGRLYRYVGPRDIAALLAEPAERSAIGSPADLLAWLAAQRPPGREATATFVVDAGGALWIADQRSEHLVCARGGPVLAAGELTAGLVGGAPRIVAATNQSTGYCPEPESWVQFARACDRAGVDRPGGWATAFVFRRCPGCASINLVKDGWFECAVCGAALPAAWNF